MWSLNLFGRELISAAKHAFGQKYGIGAKIFTIKHNGEAALATCPEKNSMAPLPSCIRARSTASSARQLP